MPAIAPRHLWAVEMLAVTPADRILEIGCGHGIATGLVCDRLTTGHLTAIDRSGRMAAACRSRNAAAVEAGRLTVLEGVFERTEFPQRFDRAFAINVDFPLHRDEGWAHGLASVVRHGGMVLLVGEAPVAATADRFARAARAALEAEGFVAEIVAGPGLAAVSARRD